MRTSTIGPRTSVVVPPAVAEKVATPDEGPPVGLQRVRTPPRSLPWVVSGSAISVADPEVSPVAVSV